MAVWQHTTIHSGADFFDWWTACDERESVQMLGVGCVALPYSRNRNDERDRHRRGQTMGARKAAKAKDMTKRAQKSHITSKPTKRAKAPRH